MDRFLQQIFSDRRADPEKLKTYGFRETDGAYLYEQPLLSGAFTLRVRVCADGADACLIDAATDEPYTLFLVEDAQGSFIGEVRAAYCDALSDIAETCFAKTVFQSGYSQSVIEYARNTYGDELEFLWEKFPKNAILRRKDNRKWYAALLTISKSKLGAFPDEEIEVLDLRAAPEAIPDMVDGKRVFAGYHMNKKHWITLPLDGTLPAEEICAMLDTSYALAKGK